MSYLQRPWAAGAYAGTGGVADRGGGVVIVDPSNPTLPGYRWLTQVGPAAFAQGAWAGGGLVDRPAAGGMSIVADPSLGQVRISAWWTGAPYLRVVRIAGGVRTPVRGGYPIRVTTATRRNLVTNPSFELATTGHLPGANTTLTRTAGPVLHGAWFGRLRATAAGTVTNTIPVQMPTDVPFGISLALLLSAAPSGALTVTATWQDQDGVAMPSSTATIAAGALTGYVGRWDRTPVLTITPPAPIGVVGSPTARIPVQGALAVSIAGMAANATADLDGILVEAGTGTSGVYFDGDLPFGQWTGSPHLSPSALAAPTDLVDGEAPLDVPVSYELSAPDQPAFRIMSEPVTLPSQGRTWLSHPSFPAGLRVEPESVPDETHGIERGLHYVLGRARPIAVSASRRHAHTGTLVVPVENFGERDRLAEFLADGSPLLLRAPGEFGRGPGEWLSIGDVGIAAPGHGAWEGTRRFTLPYAVVDPPRSDDSAAA